MVIMATRVEVKGVPEVIASLRARSLKGRVRVTARVAYEAPYATYVHEDLEAYHEVGQAKYLEQPARELRKELTAIVTRSLLGKNGLEEGVVRAAQRLLAASQPLVPVDTGYLRESGRVVVEGGTPTDRGGNR